MTEISLEACRIKKTLVRDSLDSISIADKRQAWESAAALVDIPDGVSTEECYFRGIRCIKHTPDHVICTGELIVYLHGGGLVEGSASTSREWCCRLSKASGYSVLAIDYSLAPEHPYPTAINEVLAVCDAISSHAHYSLMSIGGDSTGCVLALSAVVNLRDKDKTLPSSCFFLSPSIDLGFTGRSIISNAARDTLVSLEVLNYYAKLYSGDREVGTPEISPLFAELHQLPPVIIHVDDSELLLDDAVRLYQRVLQAGGAARLIVRQQLWHVWPTWGDFPESREATREIVEHIQRYKKGG